MKCTGKARVALETPGQVKVLRSVPFKVRALLWGVLIALHTLLLAAGFDLGITVIAGLANGFALLRGLEVYELGDEARLLRYVAGYFVLLGLLLGVAHSPLLFATFVFLYAGVFSTGLLVGYLFLLLLCLIFVSSYWLPLAVLLGIPFTIGYELSQRRQQPFAIGAFALGFMLLAALLLPIFYLMLQNTPQTLIDTAKEVDFRTALANSFWTASVSTLLVLVFGVPFAYAMARLNFRGKEIVDSLIDLPILIPQSVVGIALMVLVGPKAPLGVFLEKHAHFSVSGSFLGIIACQVFVSSPFLIRAALNAFEQMDAKLENVARTLGATPLKTFFRVSLPLAGPAIFTGCILTWARAVSETGSIIVIAYRPLTIGTLSFDYFTQYGLEEARPIAILLVLVCLWAFITLRWMRTYLQRRLSAPRTKSAPRPWSDLPLLAEVEAEGSEVE